MNLIRIAEMQSAGSHVSGTLAKIISFIEKEIGVSLVKIPGVECYTNSIDSGYGLRFVFSGKTSSIRFNWDSNGGVGHAALISSIDVWDGTSSDPQRHITTKSGESFLKVLPQLAGALDTKISEAVKGEFTPETALADFILRLRRGKTFTRGDFASAYHMSNIDVFDTLVSKFANQIVLSNKRVSAKRGTDYETLKTGILAASIESLNIDNGGDGETFDDYTDKDGGVSFIDALSHMEDLVQGIAKGAFNGLFIAGKGGVGKTQTVERTLANLGLKDGVGYYKNTGSATAAGIYALLYKYQDDIILFDDSDGALADMDSRNLIKAATDTKKVRKIAWTKSGKISDSGGLIPPSFQFHGRIIFISNLSLEKLDPDGALRTRAFVIVINPTNDELVDHMKLILPHIETEGTISLPEREKVLDVVREIGKKKDISLRTLVRALNICASGVPNWALLCRLYA